MEFNEQIKLLAKEIYTKIVKYLNANKENDDIFYRNAYLNFNNGLEAEYSFDYDTLSITKSDSQEESEDSIYLIIISNDESKYYNEPTVYDTSLKDNLTNNEEELIINDYEQLTKAIDTISYNKEKTQDVENFNYDVLDIYFDYMYELEMQKLEKIPNRILPVAKIGAAWWTNIICGDSRGGSLGNDLESKIIMSISNQIFPKESVSDEQKNKFEEILTEKIMDAILEYNGESVTINCDYGTDILIYQAMEESGVSTARTPFKTEMCINAFDVSVRNGYGAKQETLFDDTTDVDIQIVKDKYYEIYKAKKDFSKTLKLDNQK